MKADERKILHACFEKTKNLFIKRNSAEDWSHNIIEGSRELKTALQWKHFYVWMANPNNYDEEEASKLSVPTEPVVLDGYDACMRVDTFQNGPCETIVHVINVGEQDEKVDD